MLVILNNRVYNASIHNLGHTKPKTRPVIILKQSKYKVLVMQISSSNPQPKSLSKKVKNETHNVIQGIFLATSAWIEKSSLISTYLYKGKPIDITSNLKNEMLSELKTKRKQQISKLKDDIHMYITKLKIHNHNINLINLIGNKVKIWKKLNIKPNSSHGIKHFIKRLLKENAFSDAEIIVLLKTWKI